MMQFKKMSLKVVLFVLVALLVSSCSPIAPGIVPSSSPSTGEAATGEEITLFVGPEMADCVGVGPMRCLQVKFEQDGESQYFYNKIDGFTFEAGNSYELRVLRTQVDNPPADASSLAYSLIEIVSQEAATPMESAALIRLPDGTECGFTGTGATLAFDGKRLNYTCSAQDQVPFTGLIGEITQPEAGVLAVTVATIDHNDSGFVLASSQEMTFLVGEVALADGGVCAFAGMGATLAFEGERLNYTCGDPSLGLLGELRQGETGLWAATQVTLARGDNGFTISERKEVSLTRLIGAEMP